MGLFSFLFGSPSPETALGEPVSLESLPKDGCYPNSLRIKESFFIAPKPLEVGAKLSKLTHNRCTVLGNIEKGSFHKGDYVIAQVGGKPVKVLTHDVIEYDGGTFDGKLVNRQWAKGEDVTQGKSAWIVLELTVKPDEGSSVVKL